jgi:ribosomal protein S18 acetylase RimI-like enzyme
MLYRRLLASDVETYRALRLEMLRAHPDAFLTSAEEFEARSLDEIARSLGHDSSDHPETQILGAFDAVSPSVGAPLPLQAALVGSVGFSRLTRDKQRHLADIWGVYVRASARGQGAGKALFNLALKTLKGFGVELVQLGVGAHNVAARKLYASVGFVKTGVLPKALRVNGKTYDEEHMVCDLGTWQEKV